MSKPFPSKTNLLSRLQRLAVPMTEIIDVGVHRCTSELLAAFPDRKHHLFEPCSTFYPEIRRNYGHVPHVLYEMALSDVDASRFLVVTSLTRDGVPSHSAIADKPAAVDGRYVVSSNVLPVRRFDRLDVPIPPNSLLKVDVDGVDLQVLKGFGEHLSSCSVVIVELTYRTFVDMATYLEAQGFQLFDLVDLVYYGDGLYQFDGAFIRKGLVDAQVRPPIEEFRRELWQTHVPS